MLIEEIPVSKTPVHRIPLRSSVYCDALCDGRCSSIIARNDVPYQRGDIVQFELRSAGGYFRESHLINDMKFLIEYVLSGEGLDKEYVCLSISKLPETSYQGVLNLNGDAK